MPTIYSGSTPRHDLPPREAARSKPGDSIRQGRVPRGAAPALQPSAAGQVVRISACGAIYRELSARIVVSLGVVEVGEIMVQPAGSRHGWTWVCRLPLCRPTPQPAGTFAQACDALDYALRGWMEAACVVTTASQSQRLAHQRHVDARGPR